MRCALSILCPKLPLPGTWAAPDIPQAHLAGPAQAETRGTPMLISVVSLDITCLQARLFCGTFPRMQGPVKERWRELCELAAVEQDHDKLMALIQEIDRLLAEKEERLRNRTNGTRDNNR
jgi:hypothetical protein